MCSKLIFYLQAIRLDKPTGLWLLLWPTLWGLWLAGEGHPPFRYVLIFVAGVFLMRSAGCLINDFADYHFDSKVQRTKSRPLVSGKITKKEAAGLFLFFLSLASSLTYFLNGFTFFLAIIGASLAVSYPFLKRITYFPQVGLGFAFAWGIPMAFAALNKPLNPSVWWLYGAAVIWPIIYDSIYALNDIEDDKRIGVKSTAIFFNNKLTYYLVGLQILLMICLIKIGKDFHMNMGYYMSLGFVTLVLIFQNYFLINKKNYWQIFKSHQWIGILIFAGICSGYYL